LKKFKLIKQEITTKDKKVSREASIEYISEKEKSQFLIIQHPLSLFQNRTM
jgi:hypothetical protein